MGIYIDQNALKEHFKCCVKINSIDNRGFYIVAGGENGGTHYLYADGHIRSGVNGNGCAFWRTEQDAMDFWKAWKEN